MPANPYTSLTAGPSMLGREQQALVANPDLIGLERQRKMAELLLAQGMQGQPEGQMISGYYVPPAWSQRLSPVLDRLMGQQGLKEVDEKTAKLAEALRRQEVADIERFTNLQRGTPAVAEQYTEMAGPFGEGVGPNNANIPMPVAYRPAQAAVEPNRLAAIQFAAQSSSPALRAAGMKALTEGPIKVGVEDTLIDPITMQPIRQGMQKSPADIETAAIVLGLDKKPRSEWTDQDRAAIDAQIQKTKRSSAANLGEQKVFDNTLKLRGDFRSELTYKAFQEVESAYSQINKGLDAKSPAGDLAAATKFMKLLDPTSVVRESELAMAMAATGALDRLYNYAKMLTTGEKLTPNQREDFRKLSNDFYSTAYTQYNTKRDEYVDIAKRYQLPVEDVVGKAPKSPSKTMSAQDQQALNWANANPNDPRAAQIRQRLGM